MSSEKPRIVVPEDLPKLLRSLSYAVLKEKPDDIVSFAAQHFQHLYEDRGKDSPSAKDEAVKETEKGDIGNENDEDLEDNEPAKNEDSEDKEPAKDEGSEDKEPENEEDLENKEPAEDKTKTNKEN